MQRCTRPPLLVSGLQPSASQLSRCVDYHFRLGAQPRPSRSRALCRSNTRQSAHCSLCVVGNREREGNSRLELTWLCNLDCTSHPPRCAQFAFVSPSSSGPLGVDCNLHQCRSALRPSPRLTSRQAIVQLLRLHNGANGAFPVWKSRLSVAIALRLALRLPPSGGLLSRVRHRDAPLDDPGSHMSALQRPVC